MASRLIHHIVGCRQRNPTKRILLTKADMDSAYRRNHVDFLAATKSIMWVMMRGVKILVMWSHLWWLPMALRVVLCFRAHL